MEIHSHSILAFHPFLQSNPFKHQEVRIIDLKLLIEIQCLRIFSHLNVIQNLYASISWESKRWKVERKGTFFSISIDVAYRTKQSREWSLLQIHFSWKKGAKLHLCFLIEIGREMIFFFKLFLSFSDNFYSRKDSAKLSMILRTYLLLNSMWLRWFSWTTP
jgi:hypothetical protein